MATAPGMDVLLPALDGLGPVYLVGGAVRDLLVGQPSFDLDLAVEGDAREVAARLSERLGGEAVDHDRFGTATVRAQSFVADLATTRRERYPHPGTLPEVEPAGLHEDLHRRDFTVNAMAIALAEPERGVLVDPLSGREDLDAGVVRVLHPLSFLDDPTRLLRALRYEARLGFALDPDTERLVREAADAGVFATVSGARVRDELMDLLGEPEAPAAVARMRGLGVAAALDPLLDADPDRVAGAALGSTDTGADPALAALAALCCAAPGDLEHFLAGLSLPAGQREAVLRAAHRGPSLATELKRDLRRSELHALLSGEPPEALALALGLGAPGEPVLHFVSELSHIRLDIDGGDLVAAGLSPSPAVGRALEETLRRKLDGQVGGREAQLRLAIEVAREEP
ncbi:MAG: CCA tRNA nucleotidyltransferase [Thermoleophilaceae bacterium]|nr:CCA tRNA nucleotidyltransferase [Thermoleophilaceae bacterium]